MAIWAILRSILILLCLAITAITMWYGHYDKAIVWILIAIFWRLDIGLQVQEVQL